MIKIYSVLMFMLCLCLTGCRSFGELGARAQDPVVYSDPTDASEHLARIRFVGNVTGTSIRQKSNPGLKNHYLVPHTMLGFYNETWDIGIPKLTYRPQDYKGYYFEIKIRSEPTIVNISTDTGPHGYCVTSFLITPEAGKDYDLNYDQKENSKICVLHFNEIVRDPATGVTVLKPAPYQVKKKYGQGFDD